MTEHRPPQCERTARLIGRVVDGKVTPDDRGHAATCASCGPVIARAARFDDELRRSARGLITEQLPYGVLDPELAPQLVGSLPRLRHAGSALASIFAAAVILMIATAVAVAPGPPSPGTLPPADGFHVSNPIFRSTAAIVESVEELDYTCIPGQALPTTGPSARPGEREGVVCLTPTSIESASAKIVAVEKGDGEIVEVTVRAELYGTDTVTSVDELATVMGKLTFLSFADPKVAAEAGAFVEETLPRLRVLPSGDDASMVFGGNVRVYLERSIVGEYLLVLQPV